MNIKTILIILTAIILISIGIILISRSTFDNIDLSIKNDNVDYVHEIVLFLTAERTAMGIVLGKGRKIFFYDD